MAMDVLLETARCTVRLFQPEDAAALHEVLSDPEVMRYIEPAYTLPQTREFIRTAGLCEPPLVYAIAEKATGAVIGHVIWHSYDAQRYELGWVLRRDRWGRGLASELTAALITHARCAGIHALVLECAAEQTVTQHIAERFGFCRLADTPLVLYELRLN